MLGELLYFSGTGGYTLTGDPLHKMSLENETELKYDFTESSFYLVGVCSLSGLNSCLLQISVVQHANVAQGSILHCTLYRLGGMVGSWLVHSPPD